MPAHLGKAAACFTSIALLFTSSHAARSVPNWEVQPGNYDFDGSITAAVYLDAEDFGDAGDLLAAFSGDECRGVTEALETPISTFLFLLTVYSSEAVGDTLTFKFYDAGDDIIWNVTETVAFVPDMIVGSLLDPMLLHIEEFSAVTGKHDPGVLAPVSGCRLSVLPTPFLRGSQIEYQLPIATEASLCIYDLRGREVRVLADGPHSAVVHRTAWNGRDSRGRMAPAGLYLLRLQSRGAHDTRRIVMIDWLCGVSRATRVPDWARIGVF